MKGIYIHISEEQRECWEWWSCGRAPDLSIEGTAVQSHLLPFRNMAISFIAQCHRCLSEETLKAGGPFYLVSMPEEVKDPTQRVNV